MASPVPSDGMPAGLPRPDALVLRPYGRLEPLGAGALVAMVPNEPPRPGTSPRPIVLDLRSVTEVMPGALAVLSRCRPRARRAGTPLRMRCDSGPVLEQIERAGLNRVFEVERT